MAKLNTKKSNPLHRCIVFGAPKTGKSLLAGKLAEYYNLIWVDMENGHETLFQLPEAWQERIELIDIPDTRSYPMAIETCLKMVKGPVDICEEHGKAGCMICKREEKPAVHVNLPALHDLETVVVFDSLTQLSNSCIANITKGQPDDYKLDYDDWGNLGKLLDIFLSHLQQSNYHVVVISHEIEATTEGKKSKLVPVGGTRNFSRNIAKYFDHVIYCEVKNRKHTFASSTTYATTILTGSRTDVSIEDASSGSQEPSLLQIFKPELYPPVPVTSSSPATTPKVHTATNVLARLNNLKK
jgi:hypothetical protein